jgi:hypothetical protein
MKNVKDEKKKGEGKEDIYSLRDKMKKLQEAIEDYIDNMELEGTDKENDK